MQTKWKPAKSNKLVDRFKKLIPFEVDFGILRATECKCCNAWTRQESRLRGSKLAEIKQAGQTGCESCLILYDALSRYTEYLPQPNHVLAKHEIWVSILQDNLVVVFTSGDYINGRRYYDKFEYLFFCDTGKKCSEKSLAIEPALIRRCPPQSSSSDVCFDTIASWLDTCVTKHENCRLSESRFLPTRLLEVQDLRLVESRDINEKPSRFIALSHTWGAPEKRKKPMPLLLKENLKSRKDAIDPDELTQTFQDAICITQRLGIKYLWIDSLCIVQDDADDWAREAAIMSEVYGEAYLVISATRAESGDDGIFHDRQTSVKVNSPTLERVEVIQRPRHASFFTSHSPDFSQDPLLERAWCFQERILATRVLHFTGQEMVWECNEALWCECQTIAQEAVRLKEGNLDKEFKLRYHTLLHSKDEKLQRSCWNSILEGYTARQITYESDRLPALSGIARRIASMNRGRYLAGMWEHELPKALLWNLPLSSRRQQVRRLSNIPSWAWPSVGTAIVPQLGMLTTHTTVATVVDVQCHSTTADTFGKIEGGYIVLRGPTLMTKIEDAGLDHIKQLVPLDRSSDPFRMVPDTPHGLPPDGSEVMCVVIAKDTMEGRTSGLLCLVLAKCDDDWIRISQTNCPTRWNDLTKEMTIRIV